MRIGIKFFIAIVGILVFCASMTQQTNALKKAEWLLGTWELKTAKGSIFETWHQTNETKLSGKSYRIKEKDTLIFETIALVQEQNELFYIPAVKNQNDGLPVRFQSKTISETQMVFENPSHDFPQIISYTRITADSLVAEISGIRNGVERKQVFPMKRKQ